MTVLIDSWAWIEYFRGSKPGRAAQRHIEGGEPAIISPVNIAEVYRWILKNASMPEARAKQRLMVRRCRVHDFTWQLAVEAAKVWHSKGWGLGDCIVYVTAVAENARIVTGEPDFREAPNVEFVG